MEIQRIITWRFFLLILALQAEEGGVRQAQKLQLKRADPHASFSRAFFSFEYSHRFIRNLLSYLRVSSLFISQFSRNVHPSRVSSVNCVRRVVHPFASRRTCHVALLHVPPSSPPLEKAIKYQSPWDWYCSSERAIAKRISRRVFVQILWQIYHDASELTWYPWTEGA